MVTGISRNGDGVDDDRKGNGKAIKQDEKIRSHVMKFLLLILSIHFIVEVIG